MFLRIDLREPNLVDWRNSRVGTIGLLAHAHLACCHMCIECLYRRMIRWQVTQEIVVEPVDAWMGLRWPRACSYRSVIGGALDPKANGEFQSIGELLGFRKQRQNNRILRGVAARSHSSRSVRIFGNSSKKSSSDFVASGADSAHPSKNRSYDMYM